MKADRRERERQEKKQRHEDILKIERAWVTLTTRLDHANRVNKLISRSLILHWLGTFLLSKIEKRMKQVWRLALS